MRVALGQIDATKGLSLRPAGRPIALPMADEKPRRPEDGIFRPFFKAAMLVVLTLGATWGASLLLRIGLNGSFSAAGPHEINAHGHAQIFGWVGLFVMGFAYQFFPRFKQTPLVRPRLAHASLGLMVVGLVGRSLLQPIASGEPALIALASLASALEVAAVGIFAGIVLATWRGSGKPFAVPDWYVLCALGWFVVATVYEGVYLSATLFAAGPELVPLIATWQAPLRDVQIHGFALLMILGVSQRLLRSYGFPTARPFRNGIVLACVNAAVLGEVFGLLLMRTRGHAWAGLWYGSVLLLAGSVVTLVAGWHVFSAPREGDRSLKFIRAAYLWLFASLAMLVLLPAYQFGLLAAFAPESHAARIGFSHAFYGATRHAITVGFVSLMIVGVAAKVVPGFSSLRDHELPRLWLPFLLVNAGCTLRVVGQTLTDFSAASFPVTGVSGILEVTGLAIWAVHLWSIMAGRREPTVSSTC